MTMTAYVYAIIPASSAGRSPPGIDEAPVLVEREESVAALVSLLDAREYDADHIEARTADLDWIGPRAGAHHRVVTWASDQGPAVPLSMFSLYRGIDGVHAMLRDRRSEFERALASVGRGREYTLRVYRDEDAIHEALPSLRPEFAERAEALRSASPGQRYLLEKKLDQETKDAAKSLAREVAGEVYDGLRAKAVEGLREPPPRRAGDPAHVPLALNAHFLVAPEGFDDFRAVLTGLIARYDGRGFRFEFTGPWPAYHFVGTTAHVD